MTRAQRLKTLREKGLSCRTLATELGIHPSSVTRVVNGDTASLRVAEHVSSRCKVKLAVMFPRYAKLQTEAR